MTTEQRLSDALHAVHDSARPSADLESRILERVSARTRWRLGFSPRLRLGAPAAAALVVVAIIAVASGGALYRHAGSGADSSGASTPRPSSAIPLAHYDIDGLAFDYPASWQLGLAAVYGLSADTSLAQTSTMYCSAFIAADATTYFFYPTGTSECEPGTPAGAGQILVAVEKYTDPALKSPIDPSNPSTLQGQSFVTVGGLPAEFTDLSDSGATELNLVWSLSVPGSIDSRYTIQAQAQGPGLNEMRAQVTDLIASVRYDPPPVALNAADAGRVLAIGLGKAKASDPSLACFPAVPDATDAATVMDPGPSGTMVGPYPGVCVTQIAPYAIGLWKMSLTQKEWFPDGGGGAQTIVIWLYPDGTPGPEFYGPVPEGMGG
jgi:hypothetical protein